MKSRCPCHSGQAYQTCCQPLHLGQAAPDAEGLMRARYSAYTLKMDDYLRNSWHSSTRPNDLTQADLQGMKWLDLEIVEAKSHDVQHATVTFKARFRSGHHKTQTLHETSNFIFEHGDWFYVDGEIHAASV